MRPQCPLCDNPAVRETRFPGILACRRHGRFDWFDRSRMGDVDLVQIYQSYPYNDSLERDYAGMRPKYIRGLRRRILRHFKAVEGLSFLDVGCANGEYLDCARELGLGPIAGVEIDQAAAARAVRHAPVFRSMSEAPGPYDIVQCKNVISNIEDVHGFFAELLRLTKPGGILFLDVLNQSGLVAGLKKRLGRPGILRPPFVINGFSKPSLAALTARHGARISSLGTTYAGSDLLPYRESFGLAVRGRIAKAFGLATMITADIIPAAASGGS